MTFSLGIGAGILITLVSVVGLIVLITVTGAYGPRF